MAVLDRPDVDIVGRRIEPENIVGTVAVEVAGARWLPAGRMRADVRACGPVHGRRGKECGCRHGAISERKMLDRTDDVGAVRRTRPHVDDLDVAVSELADAIVRPLAAERRGVVTDLALDRVVVALAREDIV